MEAAAAGIPRARETPVSLLQVVRDALTGATNRWNPEDDEAVRFLREQRMYAEREAERLRAEHRSSVAEALLRARRRGREP
jgi:predicted lipid-binding transport protein (Tim44 family)